MVFDTKVKDCAILVVNPNHARFGQIGRLEWHDWKEYGMMGIRFRDGKLEEFYDGTMAGDEPSQVRNFYRHNDVRGAEFDRKDAGPFSLQRKFLELDVGSIKRLADQYKALFEEELPKQSSSTSPS